MNAEDLREIIHELEKAIRYIEKDERFAYDDSKRCVERAKALMGSL